MHCNGALKLKSGASRTVSIWQNEVKKGKQNKTNQHFLQLEICEAFGLLISCTRGAHLRLGAFS